MHIDDASSIADHFNKAVAQDCFLAKATPLPDAADEALEFTSTTPSSKLHPFRGSQLTRAADYVDLTSGGRRIWGNAAPPDIKSATCKMGHIASSALLGNYEMGGASRMAQFAYGPPLVGDLSQEGVFPMGTSLNPPPPSRGSGLTHSGAL